MELYLLCSFTLRFEGLSDLFHHIFSRTKSNFTVLSKHQPGLFKCQLYPDMCDEHVSQLAWQANNTSFRFHIFPSSIMKGIQLVHTGKKNLFRWFFSVCWFRGNLAASFFYRFRWSHHPPHWLVGPRSALWQFVWDSIKRDTHIHTHHRAVHSDVGWCGPMLVYRVDASKRK